MCDAFTDGFCLRLQGVLEPEKIREVRDLLSIYTMDYQITPMTTEVSVTAYQLPEAYKIYIAAKVQDGKMKPGTQGQYRMCLEKFLYRFCLPLDKITVNHIRLYLSEISKNQLTGKPITTATLNQRKAILRSFFHWLYEEEYIPKDPSIRIRPDRNNAKPRTAYTDEQVEIIRASCKTLRDRAIVDLLVSSGIRAQECVGLDRADIDLEKREITVFGKGEKWRTSYIDAAAVVSIKKYLDSRTDDNPALFVSNKAPHERLKYGGMRTMLQALSGSSGVPHIIAHRFRHTMATEAIEAGMPIESVQTILGHTEITTTRRYAHVSNGKAKADYKRYIK